MKMDIEFKDRCYGTNNYDNTYYCMGYTIEDVTTVNHGDSLTISGIVVDTNENFNAYIDDNCISVNIGNKKHKK